MVVRSNALKSSGKRGVPQGEGYFTPDFKYLILNEVDKMLEQAKEVTCRRSGFTHIEYARFADDLVVFGRLVLSYNGIG